MLDLAVPEVCVVLGADRGAAQVGRRRQCASRPARAAASTFPLTSAAAAGSPRLLPPLPLLLVTQSGTSDARVKRILWPSLRLLKTFVFRSSPTHLLRLRCFETEQTAVLLGETTFIGTGIFASVHASNRLFPRNHS